MRLIVLRICDVSFGKMKEGKQKCRILKTIRKQIAEANDIKLVTSKCRYRGDCLGTCPKCGNHSIFRLDTHRNPAYLCGITNY